MDEEDDEVWTEEDTEMEVDEEASEGEAELVIENPFEEVPSNAVHIEFPLYRLGSVQSRRRSRGAA